MIEDLIGIVGAITLLGFIVYGLWQLVMYLRDRQKRWSERHRWKRR